MYHALYLYGVPLCSILTAGDYVTSILLRSRFVGTWETPDWDTPPRRPLENLEKNARSHLPFSHAARSAARLTPPFSILRSLSCTDLTE